MWTAEQRLEVQRGDCPPTTVVKFVAPGTSPDIGLCELYGRFREGTPGVTVAPLQRLGMSPDGRTILFEVSTKNAGLPGPTFEVPEEEQGVFAVNRDGSDLRRVSGEIRERPFKGPLFPYAFPPGFNLLTSPYFNFSPDGRFVVFADRGPGSDGTDAAQLVVMDVRSGERTQVTTLSATTQSPPEGADLYGFFVDDDTITGATLRLNADNTSYFADSFLVRRDGRGFHYFVTPTPIPGSQVIENFQVAGREGNVITLTMPGTATEPNTGPVREVWTRSGADLLQLTNFGRSDTGGGALSRDGGRVFFKASANPFDTNRSNNCQLFSVPRLGGTLRQMTRFDPPMPSTDGCDRNVPPPGCIVLFFQVDPVTGSVVFSWTCDPFGLNPVSQQVFAMRPDGAGLRQLTNYGGLREEPDGTLSVELPNPTVYSARDQSAGHGRRTGPR